MAGSEFLQSLIPLISPLLVLSVCSYYLIRSKQLDAVLLAAGAVIRLLMTAFIIYIPYYAQAQSLAMSNLTYYYAATGLISLAGTIAFTLGLFLLINKVLKLTEKTTQVNKFY